MTEDLPGAVGLCPGNHTKEWYMPDANPGDRCPECDCKLVVYTPISHVKHPTEPCAECRREAL